MYFCLTLTVILLHTVQVFVFVLEHTMSVNIGDLFQLSLNQVPQYQIAIVQHSLTNFVTYVLDSET